MVLEKFFNCVTYSITQNPYISNTYKKCDIRELYKKGKGLLSQF